MIWRRTAVCVVLAILVGLSAFTPHIDSNNNSRRGTMLWSLSPQPPLTNNRAIYHSTLESSARSSFYTLLCRVMNQLWLRMSTSQKQLTQDLEAAYCYVCLKFGYVRNELHQYMYVQGISEQLQFAHLPSSTLYEHLRWNNKSTYWCQLIRFWAKSNLFTVPSHIVCLGYIAILPYYSRFIGEIQTLSIMILNS